MPTYNFTSDLRISELRQRIIRAAELISTDKLLEQDKSTQNNGNTLAFYFNLQPNTNTINLAIKGKVTEVIRNMVLKFQFPNPYTNEVMKQNLEESTYVAPLREVVKILAYMHLIYQDYNPYLTYDEIRYYIFCHPKRLANINPTDYKQIIAEIKLNRNNNFDYNADVEVGLKWAQYERQSREMIKIIAFTSEAFKVESGKIVLSMPNPTDEQYSSCLHFVSEALQYDYYWQPNNIDEPEEVKRSYIKYMDINGDIDYSPQILRANIEDSNKLANSLDCLPLQQIFFGAPGTGKSHSIKKVCAQYEHYRTTFHPDTDYASFVGSYKPITEEVIKYDQKGNTYTEKRIVYNYSTQAFLKAYVAAWQEQQNETPAPVFLIIEEINRGNCAQIFGDIFQLLDRNENGFSEYPIVTDVDLKQELERIFNGLEIYNASTIDALYSENQKIVEKVLSGDHLLLPNNLYIWATMNTSDQSLFPIDSAFKRRWDWKYIKIRRYPTNYTIVFKNGNKYDWGEFIETINTKIEGGEIQQEDKQLGYFFAKAKDGKITADKFVSKVIFYLYNDVFKDYGLDEDFFKDEEDKTMTFSSYFNNNGEVDESRVERFIINLGLSPINKQSEDEDGEVIEGLSVNGKSVRTITAAVIEILKVAAQGNNFDEILDTTSSIFDRDDVVKSIENPESYEKENRWNRTPIQSVDKAFVVSNQWQKEMLPQVKELAEYYGIPFDFAVGDALSTTNASNGKISIFVNNTPVKSLRRTMYEITKQALNSNPSLTLAKLESYGEQSGFIPPQKGNLFLREADIPMWEQDHAKDSTSKDRYYFKPEDYLTDANGIQFVVYAQWRDKCISAISQFAKLLNIQVTFE